LDGQLKLLGQDFQVFAVAGKAFPFYVNKIFLLVVADMNSFAFKAGLGG